MKRYFNPTTKEFTNRNPYSTMQEWSWEGSQSWWFLGYLVVRQREIIKNIEGLRNKQKHIEAQIEKVRELIGAYEAIWNAEKDRQRGEALLR